MAYFYPIRLAGSLHETIWGGRRLERDRWKQLPSQEVAIGESWETEVSTIVQNGPYAGQTLGEVVNELGSALLGAQAVKTFGQRFPLLAKFIDANAQLSVQVHPTDEYAAIHECGNLGKTEFWYILAAEPGARIVYGFKTATTREAVQEAIQTVTLDRLLYEEVVQPGDVIFVPAGTVHAIGSGVMLYELQEYSDVTYRMYDYGRLTASGKARDLHIERSLDVARYDGATRGKVKPVALASGTGYEERCLVACKCFLTRELNLQPPAVVESSTTNSCVIMTSLGAAIEVQYGPAYRYSEALERGQTMVLPAALGNYRLVGSGLLLCSYVPWLEDEAWQAWRAVNTQWSH